MNKCRLFYILSVCWIFTCATYGAENQLRVAYIFPEDIQTFVDEWGGTVVATGMDLNVDWAENRTQIMEKVASIYQGNPTLGINTPSGMGVSVKHFESLGWKVNLYGCTTQQSLTENIIKNNDVIVNAEYNASAETVGQIVGSDQILPLVDSESFHLDDWKFPQRKEHRIVLQPVPT